MYSGHSPAADAVHRLPARILNRTDSRLWGFVIAIAATSSIGGFLFQPSSTPPPYQGALVVFIINAFSGLVYLMAYLRIDWPTSPGKASLSAVASHAARKGITQALMSFMRTPWACYRWQPWRNTEGRPHFEQIDLTELTFAGFVFRNTISAVLLCLPAASFLVMNPPWVMLLCLAPPYIAVVRAFLQNPFRQTAYWSLVADRDGIDMPSWSGRRRRLLWDEYDLEVVGVYGYSACIRVTPRSGGRSRRMVINRSALAGLCGLLVERDSGPARGKD